MEKEQLESANVVEANELLKRWPGVSEDELAGMVRGGTLPAFLVSKRLRSPNGEIFYYCTRVSAPIEIPQWGPFKVGCWDKIIFKTNDIKNIEEVHPDFTWADIDREEQEKAAEKHRQRREQEADAAWAVPSRGLSLIPTPRSVKNKGTVCGVTPAAPAQAPVAAPAAPAQAQATCAAPLESEHTSSIPSPNEQTEAKPAQIEDGRPLNEIYKEVMDPLYQNNHDEWLSLEIYRATHLEGRGNRDISKQHEISVRSVTRRIDKGKELAAQRGLPLLHVPPNRKKKFGR